MFVADFCSEYPRKLFTRKQAVSRFGLSFSFLEKTGRHQRNDAEENAEISVLLTRGLELSPSSHNHHLLLGLTLVDRKTSAEN